MNELNNHDEEIRFQAFAGIATGCAMYLLVGVVALILCLLFGF